MAYTLLYSRNITSDDRVRFTDVPITETSIMVDILSLRSPFYRIAGYAYSIVSDGLIDYERGAGYTLPFGKNRLFFPSSPKPYFLEFFPKWGTRQAIVSVYTGQPSSQSPPGEWKPFPQWDIELRLISSPAAIEYRSPIGATAIQLKAFGAVAGFVWNGFLLWKNADDTTYYSGLGDIQSESPNNLSNYELRRQESSAVIL